MEEKNNSIFEQSIDFIGVLKKCWTYMLIVALVFALLAASYTTIFVSKTYSSTVKFYVVIDRSSAQYLNTELQAAQTLIDSYSVVVKNSDSFLRKVIEQSKLSSLTPSRLRSMLSVSSIGSEAFSVKVTSTDPQLSYDIAKIIEEIGPDEMVKFVEAGNVKVLNPPFLSLTPDSPNIVKNVMIFALFGAILTYGIFLLFAMLDTRIHSEEDLRRFDIPLLGSVPTMNMENTSKKKVYKSEDLKTKS